MSLSLDFGNFCLIASWTLAMWSVIVGFFGAYTRDARASRSAAIAVHGTALLSVLSLVYLAKAFVIHDYRYLYVWQHSNNTMHPVYLVSAIWGGMDGSMLLWAALMAVFCSIASLRTWEYQRLLVWALPVFGLASGFFLSVVSFLTNPFRLVPGLPYLADGNGLNPLLQNPSMVIHPPMLYLGFTGFVVPFAFCLAALFSRQLGDTWIRVTRRWTLVAWTFLTFGIILGGNWAYIELGWGGFWAWDPVENASFLPWLTATAFLHSVMVQEHRGMLKVWNICLSIATYGLTVFGTFLTRSGIVQSVHAFAATDVGWVFLAYLGAMLVLSTILLISRWHLLKPDNQLQSYLSREAAFLFNNLALLGICFATLWGVMFPVISEAIAGEKSVVGPPFFNRVNTPLFLILIFLMGVGPIIAWRRASLRQIVKLFGVPFVTGSIITSIFLFADIERIYTAMSFGLCVFVIMTIESEFRRGVKAQRAMQGSEGKTAGGGLVTLIRRKPRRYGGFLVHLGVAIMAIGITAASAYKIERDITLRPGEEEVVGRYRLRLESLQEVNERSYEGVGAVIGVYDSSTGEFIRTMHPERRAYRGSEEVTSEVDIRMTLRDDLYVALTGVDVPRDAKITSLEGLPALLKVFINPLQVWVWFGGCVLLLGSLVVLLPSFRREAHGEFARVDHARQRAVT